MEHLYVTETKFLIFGLPRDFILQTTTEQLLLYIFLQFYNFWNKIFQINEIKGLLIVDNLNSSYSSLTEISAECVVWGLEIATGYLCVIFFKAIT